MKRLLAIRRYLLTTSANGIARGFLIALLLSGCVGEYEIPIQPALERPPLIEPLQLTMGTYYSSAFSTYEHRETDVPEYKSTYIFSLGPPSVAMFDRVFAGMFKKTLSVERWPPAAGNRPDVAAVIETKIEGFWWHMPRPAFARTSTLRVPAEITYRFIVYTAKGETVASWTVTGSGLHTPRSEVNLHPARTWLSAAIKLAMRDAAAKFVAEFPDQPQIKDWLQRTGVASGGAQ